MEFATYNIRAGAFANYYSEAEEPEYLDSLQETVRHLNVDLLGLVDTFRWTEVFDNEYLKKLFGYDQVYCINMNDVRVDQRIGLTMLARGMDVSFGTVRLGSRDCIKAVISRDSGPLVVYLVYLDDMSAIDRLKQINALRRDANQYHWTTPVIVMGDLNELQPGALPWRLRCLGSLAGKPLVRHIKPALVQCARELRRYNVLPALQSAGFVDFMPAMGPVSTYESKLPGWGWLGRVRLRVDYLLARNIVIRDVAVVPIGDSDHWPLRGSAQPV